MCPIIIEGTNVTETICMERRCRKFHWHRFWFHLLKSYNYVLHSNVGKGAFRFNHKP